MKSKKSKQREIHKIIEEKSKEFDKELKSSKSSYSTKELTNREQRLYQEENRKRAEKFLTSDQYNQIERIKTMFDMEGIIGNDKNMIGNALMIYLWGRDNEEKSLMINSNGCNNIEELANKYCDPKPVFKGMPFEQFLDFFKIRIRRISPTENLN